MKPSTCKSVALWYPCFMGGGAEAVALWMLEALKDKYDVTLFTVADISFEKLNGMYGTQLSKEQITVKALSPALFTSICHFLTANNADVRMLLMHLLIRFFKANNQSFDLVISAYNAMDLGRQGLQYIHWINVLEGKKAIYRNISNFSTEQLRENISISNSHFVADRVKTAYGIESSVIYPPVVMESRDIPWEQKEDAFICSGRLVASKQPHKVIKILKAVRRQGFDVKLYMTGGGGGASNVKYRRLVMKMAEENASWVTVYENLKYKDYVDVVDKCKYGIHYKQEPFGISIAEMVKAGAIPFVRSQGGHVEIVGANNSGLFFDSDAKAIEQIVGVLSSVEKQEHLRSALAEQKELFSTHRFMEEISKAVDHYFSNLYKNSTAKLS
jgi:glycosyltransferase involved in cell wall biosynthesis